MNILIITIGTRGDIQPYIALGAGLVQAGHSVTINTSPRFESFAAEHGLNFAPMRADMMEMMETGEGRAALNSKKDAFKMMREVMPMIRRSLDDQWAAAQKSQAQAVIYHAKALGGYHITQALNVPGFLAMPLPISAPTRAFPNPVLPALPLGGSFNRLGYTLLNRLLATPYHGLLNDWRRNDLKLPARPRFADDLRRDGQPVQILYAYSSQVVPTPDDWGPEVHVTGYWFLDSGEWQPPDGLRAFLEAGPPPVYVGFGSMAGQDTQKTTRYILDALAQSGQRGVLASGVGGLSVDHIPDNVYVLESAPHDWLFPRMAAVVHHGGAGTTAAGLRAGKPTIIAPFFGDQPFWGKRVVELGVGPQPLPQKQLTAHNLAAAIRMAVSDDGMKARASALGEHIRAEDGISNAVAVIERHLN